MHYILVISFLFSLNSFTMEKEDGWIFSVPLGRFVQEMPKVHAGQPIVENVDAIPQSGDDAEIYRRQITDRTLRVLGERDARNDEMDMLRDLFE